MYCITDAQIRFMLDDFRARGIKLESLQQDLLDHVCCIIEQSLEEHGDFEGCYRQTIATFYQEQLAEIETETLLLQSFKNYYAMKKIMIAGGALSVLAFLTGSFLKLLHLPGASVLLFLGILCFCFLFLPLLLLLKMKEQIAPRDKALFGLGTVLAITYFLSMLLKVMHWPGANVMWYSTLSLTFLLFIPAFFITGMRQPERRFNTMVVTILLVAFTGLQFTMTALRSPAPVMTATGETTLPAVAVNPVK